MRTRRILLCTTTLLVAASAALAEGPLPTIAAIAATDTGIVLDITDLTDGASYSVERSPVVVNTAWTNQYSFAGFVGSTNWTDTTAGLLPAAYYRVGRTAYHEKVGQAAELITRFHGVTGTATITDNTTITVTQFNYDATGLDVRFIVSDNAGFYPYTEISGDLVRQEPPDPYVDETLVLTVPVSLDSVAYISVWCIPAMASFGDGAFVE